jgi:ABC-type branched-subunit amino acid transport system ATPase component
MEDVANVIAAQVKRDRLVDILRALYQQSTPSPSRLERELGAIPFSSALSTSWDSSLERIFAHRAPVVLKGASEEDSSKGYDPNRFVIAKLHGDIRDASSLRFTVEEYREMMYRNEPFARVVSSMIRNKSILFLGVSESGISDFFSAFPGTSVSFPHKHYALLPDTLAVKVQKDRFRSRFGVETITYVSKDPGSAAGAFINGLGRAITAMPSAPRPIAGTLLRSVRLSNIGPYEEIEFEVNSQWNVLIGNNASGKSTVLKAIALGLCGDDPQVVSAAAALLRVGQNRGTIELRVDDSIYRTDLQLDGSTVRVSCKQVTPLQQGSWTVLGFPALRGMGGENPRRYSPDQVGKPAISDLLPLMLGRSDSRLEDLKSWIIYLQVNNETPQGFRPKSLQSIPIVDRFFSIVRDLLPGTDISLDSIDVKKWEVRVKTADGIIPIDQLSQGVVSALGWIGTLLQRLYEINEHASAEDQAALVLVDELEAHLHPEWQQAIVQLVKNHFPAIQILATTHSPLVIANLARSEILVCTRRSDGESPQLKNASIDPAGMRVDQILTSPLFGLVSTRGASSENAIREYSELLGRSRRSPVEEKRLQELRSQLSASLKTGETLRERLIEDSIQQTVERFISPELLLATKSSKEVSELVGDLIRLKSSWVHSFSEVEQIDDKEE